MDKETLSKIVSIVISAVLAILAVFGYNFVIVQPALTNITAQVQAVGPTVESRGVNVDSYREALWVDREFTSAGTTTLSGPLLGASPLILEGATADAYETTFAITDPSADRTITFPNSSGTVALNPAAGTWEFEGATADDYETTLTITDPTADRTVTIPNTSGTVGLIAGTGMDTVIYGSSVVTGTATITHGLTTPRAVFCTLGTDPVDNEEDRCTATISGSTVTVKVWKEAATPTAGDSGVTIYWQVAGTK